MKKSASKKSELSLTKMQGAGNSFLILDSAKKLKRPEQAAQALCDFHFGAGADGLVVLKKQGSRIGWDFYNSDGSAAEFCGNAARCVAQYAFEAWKIKKISLETRAGVVECEVKKSNRVRIQMPKPQWIQKELKTPFWDKPVAWINTGVPHLVVEVSTESELKAHTAEAKKLRFWEGLGDGGANVTFLYFLNEKNVSAVTFERGVEGYTLACGTGAVAAGLFAMAKNKTKECLVTMPGGDLKISDEKNKIYMEGEAWRIADIKISASILS